MTVVVLAFQFFGFSCGLHRAVIVETKRRTGQPGLEPRSYGFCGRGNCRQTVATQTQDYTGKVPRLLAGLSRLEIGGLVPHCIVCTA